jgi:hypothetical protein
MPPQKKKSLSRKARKERKENQENQTILLCVSLRALRDTVLKGML